MKIITLTTDFGLEDEYAGVMKGVIISRAPGARLVDLTHLIPPQDIKRAALLIQSAYHSFPAHTIHVIVVDPGVGSRRRIILLQKQNQLFLAPDNGVLTLLLDDDCRAREVSNHNLFLEKISNTFHGRDIFAPVAAALASGLDPADVGPEIAIKKLIKLPWPGIAISREEIRGQIVYIDHFGNLISNIHYRLLPKFFRENIAGLTVTIKNRFIRPIKANYQEGEESEIMALFNSGNYLEISLKNGDAARFLGCHGQEEVKITLTK